MSLDLLSFESILRYHVNVWSMVALDIGTDDFTLLGEQARKRCRSPKDELRHHGIAFKQIT